MNSPYEAELLLELQELVDQLLDAQLSLLECQRLEELVCSSPACGDYYVRVMQLNAGLARGAMLPLHVDGLQMDLTDEAGGIRSPREARGPVASPLPTIPFDVEPEVANPTAMLSVFDLPGSEDTGWIAGLRQARDWTLGQWQFSTVVVVTVCLLGLIFWNRGIEAPIREGDQRPPVVNSLQNDAGTVTLALDKIGTVTLEGPTDFRMVGPLRARLNYGNITVHVSEETGHGFVIETPDGDVTDFGTKFSLNVSKGNDTKLMVREGSVDLRPGTWRQPGKDDRRERLVGGQAVSFNAAGNIQRIMSIVAGRTNGLNSSADLPKDDVDPVIVSVSDNLNYPITKNYYEIVPGGLQEDAPACVDRLHQWNGLDENGIPTYLRGADYVKTFTNRFKLGGMSLKVQLCRPAKLYVFADDRVPPVEWLMREFQPTGDYIGLDMISVAKRRGKTITRREGGKGPGLSIDVRYSIWVREVTSPGVIVIDANLDPKNGMYGIAAVELKTGSNVAAENLPSVVCD